MPKTTPDRLLPGMITARSVVNANGMVLLGENTLLTAELIDRIRNMEVEGLFICGSSKPSIPRQTALDDLRRRFELSLDTPAMNIIKSAALKHMESLYEQY
ncbi:MAG: hypothetical protein ACYDHW_15000 [Syntrophorhabdaceae bacterium]